MRKRNLKGLGRNPICKCGKLKERPAQGWCNACRNAYSRANRKRHSQLSEEDRKRANCRSYLNVYIRRGTIKKGVCEICGSDYKIEAHHEDYNKPLEVTWLCRNHHLEKHLAHQSFNLERPID